ncbi:MAG: DUF3846 domain-containing protein [Oscillospiraceae bacterium]
MKINIYQINTDRDPKQLKFLCLDTARRILHSAEPDSAAYDKVYSGDVKCRNLEDVFTLFHSGRPEGFRGHSLSVSDVVEVEDAVGITPGFYFCDSFGFKEIPFQPELAAGAVRGPTIQVVLVEPGKTARIAEVGTSLDAMQQTVGGDIEAYYPFEEQACIVCNDEGKINGLPLNRAIRDEDTNEIVDIIAGTFFICDCRKESFGSLSEEQQKRYLEKYRLPERFFRTRDGIEAVPYKPKDRDR